MAKKSSKKSSKKAAPKKAAPAKKSVVSKIGSAIKGAVSKVASTAQKVSAAKNKVVAKAVPKISSALVSRPLGVTGIKKAAPKAPANINWSASAPRAGVSSLGAMKKNTTISSPSSWKNVFSTPSGGGSSNQTYSQSYSAPQQQTTGDSKYDEILKVLESQIIAQQEMGNMLNPALNIDQETIDRFLTQAQKETEPLYSQMIQQVKDDVVNEAGLLAKQYESEVAGQEQAFTGNLANFREQQAGAGTAFSGGRATQEFGQQAEQNRYLQDLSDETANKFRTLGRDAEEKIGTGNVTYELPSFMKRQSFLEGGGGYNNAGNVQGYQKGAFQLGKLPMEQTSTARGIQQQYLNEAYQRAANGQSWQDLFN